jgi:phage terminase large subunit-like protein
MIDVRQNVLNLPEPMKQLDALTIAGRIQHNGEAKENVPRKARADNKIDPAVALISASLSPNEEQVAFFAPSLKPGTGQLAAGS